MEIALVRHGKPKLPPLDRLNAAAFCGWIRQYDAAPLSGESVPDYGALRYAEGCGAILCSGLSRSIESGRVLGAGRIALTDPLFDEAGLPCADWRRPRLSPKVWAVVFRVAWFFGYSRGSESYGEAKRRARAAVERLEALAEAHARVLLVGHGVFNRLLVMELRRRGWSGPRDAGSRHWDYGVYRR